MGIDRDNMGIDRTCEQCWNLYVLTCMFPVKVGRCFKMSIPIYLTKQLLGNNWINDLHQLLYHPFPWHHRNCWEDRCQSLDQIWPNSVRNWLAILSDISYFMFCFDLHSERCWWGPCVFWEGTQILLNTFFVWSRSAMLSSILTLLHAGVIKYIGSHWLIWV